MKNDTDRARHFTSPRTEDAMLADCEAKAFLINTKPATTKVANVAATKIPSPYIRTAMAAASQAMTIISKR